MGREEEHLQWKLKNLVNLRVYSDGLSGVGIPKDKNLAVETYDGRNALVLLDLNTPEAREFYDKFRKSYVEQKIAQTL